ncbi:unnamed protein product [Ostreobium quekettii]|uniref:Uncharacterized protein n=1 Tax=Ostreobium quekettii TaxID=121088 RepID=A0A8S1IX16_9CHLO|nr:unnamed protein product [Ostreobium quekettii]
MLGCKILVSEGDAEGWEVLRSGTYWNNLTLRLGRFKRVGCVRNFVEFIRKPCSWCFGVCGLSHSVTQLLLQHRGKPPWPNLGSLVSFWAAPETGDVTAQVDFKSCSCLFGQP